MSNKQTVPFGKYGEAVFVLTSPDTARVYTDDASPIKINGVEYTFDASYSLDKSTGKFQNTTHGYSLRRLGPDRWTKDASRAAMSVAYDLGGEIANRYATDKTAQANAVREFRDDRRADLAKKVEAARKALADAEKTLADMDSAPKNACGKQQESRFGGTYCVLRAGHFGDHKQV